MKDEYRLPRLLLGCSVVVPSNSKSSSSQSYNGNSILNSYLLIVLAALLLALLCALDLRAIIRSVLRYNTRFPLESTEAATSHLASNGLDKGELKKIAVMVYEPGMRTFSATDCPICLGEFEQGEKLRMLPRCNHGFHVKCIDEWFSSHSSCPTCRQPLVLHDVESKT
uniref:RING-type E3 ubiquitin transferase n=3 Tax=Nicotiana TaxID=4085 RepID=A0A1S4ALR7_TOBAC|nr:PREDICTED: RING-H2 finger protein ATL72-like isoform X2 [Nicotiana sylvestris]XP_016477611.1 PREDICTED: RING-H2 finger protein ATL72-like [Nicotiana tabacum]